MKTHRDRQDHRTLMTRYYKMHSLIYDATRWTFLYGRDRLTESLLIQPGECVVEIGCGTGKNFEAIQRGLCGTGELIGIDCSAPMLKKAEQRVKKNGWNNVRLLDHEYGRQTVTRGEADVVLFSYSLSMIPNWELALASAHAELRPGGRIGVVDFCKEPSGSGKFSDWLALNHVTTDRPYELRLQERFHKKTHLRHNVWAGLWSFYLFIGERNDLRKLEVA